MKSLVDRFTIGGGCCLVLHYHILLQLNATFFQTTSNNHCDCGYTDRHRLMEFLRESLTAARDDHAEWQ